MAVKKDKVNYKLPTVNIWYPNQVEPDPENKEEFIKYWKREKERCINGFTLADGQVYVSGWLYFHTVYWTIELDKEYINPITGKKSSGKTKGTPILRDIDWMVGKDIERVEEEKCIYDLVACRGVGKSVWAGSFIGQSYLFFDDSENILSGGNNPDIFKLAEKVALGLDNIHPVFSKQRIKNNWKQEVRAGWEDKSTGVIKGSNSRIITRNYDNGNNSMATNGTRPKRQILDEQGKLSKLIPCILDSMPSWMNDYGFFSVVFLTGCVCAGTKVWTNSGKLVNIEDLKQEDGILGYSGTGVSKESITWMKPPAIKPCFRIQTTSGNYIECSEDHPILVSNIKNRTSKNGVQNINFSEFKQAKDIIVGDRLYSVDKINVFGNLRVEHARLIGILVGDGYYGSGVSISIDDVVTREFVTSNYKTKVKKSFETKKGELYTELTISEMIPYLREIGIYGQSKFTKRLPSNIDEYDRQSLAELIAGYFDADGTVTYNVRKGKSRIVLTSVVFELLEQIKYQLHKFGIRSFICTENRNTTPSEEYRGQQGYICRLYISKDEDVQRFKDNIPIIHSKKVWELERFNNSKALVGRAKTSFKYKEDYTKGKYFKDIDYLEGFVYDIVKSIEYIGEKEVYNLTAGTTNTYLANGFITHNTGGDFEVGEDAGKIFNNPRLYNVLEFDDIWEGQGKIGRFIPVTLGRNEYKEEWSLYKYLKEKVPGYENLQPHPELDIIIKVSNEERCMKEFVEPRRAKALKSTSSNEIIKEKAYYPIVPSECFLTLNANDFPVEAIKEHLQNLIDNNFKPIRIELYEDLTGRLTHKFTDKMPVADFPVTSSSNKEGVIEVVEFPVDSAPWGTYVAGIDPYKQSESDYSDSLGAVYIFKRMTTNMTEPYQHMPVAWYVGRPKNIRDWHDNVRKLLEFYNAEAMCEANDHTFIEYMMGLNKQHYLAKGQSYLREISPTSKFKGGYGLPATPKTIEHWNNSFVIYTKELYSKLRLEDDTSKDMLGISRILDPMLLQELLKFNKHSGNFDRIRACSLAIAYANQLDALVGKMELEDEYRVKTKIIKSPFGLNRIGNSSNKSSVGFKSNSPFLINKLR